LNVRANAMTGQRTRSILRPINPTTGDESNRAPGRTDPGHRTS